MLDFTNASSGTPSLLKKSQEFRQLWRASSKIKARAYLRDAWNVRTSGCKSSQRCVCAQQDEAGQPFQSVCKEQLDNTKGALQQSKHHPKINSIQIYFIDLNNYMKTYFQSFLVVLQGAIAFAVAYCSIQYMNQISSISSLIFSWDQANASTYYSLSNSLMFVTGIFFQLGISSLLFEKLGRLNSIRIGHVINIIGIAIILSRNTVALLVGRIIMGVSLSILLSNAVPYSISFIPEQNKYFFGSLTTALGRLGPFCHALISLSSKGTIPNQNNIWMLVASFPAILSVVSLSLSLVLCYDGVDSYSIKCNFDEQDVKAYFIEIIEQQQSKRLLNAIRQSRAKTDYSLREYFCNSDINGKTLIGISMMLVRHWTGSVVYVIFLGYFLNKFQTDQVALNYLILTLASQIWMVVITSILFYFVKEVKKMWLIGLALQAAANFFEAAFLFQANLTIMKYVFLFQRQAFIITLDSILYNYIGRLLPPNGFNLCVLFFNLFAFLATQTVTVMYQTLKSLPYLVYGSVSVVCLLFFAVKMKEIEVVSVALQVKANANVNVNENVNNLQSDRRMTQ